MTELKNSVLESCKALLGIKLSETLQDIADLKESMAAESRSSAGDKHETARARMQSSEAQLFLQLDQQRAQLDEIDRLMNFGAGNEIVHGSLVETDKGFFLIAISLGKISVGDLRVQVISQGSPFGKLLLGLKKHSEFSVNGVDYTILNIF